MIKNEIIYENYMKILFIHFWGANKIKLFYFDISIIQNIYFQKTFSKVGTSVLKIISANYNFGIKCKIIVYIYVRV